MDQAEPARPPFPKPRHTAFALTVAFDLVPEYRERFLDLVRANAEASLNQEPDCLTFDVLLPATEGGPDVLLYEIYASRAAFDLHLASAHFKDFDGATRTMVRRKVVSEFIVEEHDRRR